MRKWIGAFFFWKFDSPVEKFKTRLFNWNIKKKKTIENRFGLSIRFKKAPVKWSVKALDFNHLRRLPRAFVRLNFQINIFFSSMFSSLSVFPHLLNLFTPTLNFILHTADTHFYLRKKFSTFDFSRVFKIVYLTPSQGYLHDLSRPSRHCNTLLGSSKEHLDLSIILQRRF